VNTIYSIKPRENIRKRGREIIRGTSKEVLRMRWLKSLKFREPPVIVANTMLAFWITMVLPIVMAALAKGRWKPDD